MELVFTMDQHAFVVAQSAEFVRLDFVLLGFRIIDAALAGA